MSLSITKIFRKRCSINDNDNLISSPKRTKSPDFTSRLPEEILIYIFSFLPHEDLYRSVRYVNKKWHALTYCPLLWRKITAKGEIPTEALCKWIEHSPQLTELNLQERSDVNLITEKVSKCCRKLESLKIENSKGTKKSNLMKSKNLCNLLAKCKYLQHIHFSGVKLRSYKFFKILSGRKHLSAKRKCSYFGPINHKQMKVLIESIISNDMYEAATLFTANNRRLSLKKRSNDTNQNYSNVLETINNIWEDVTHFNEIDYPLYEDDEDEDYLPDERNNM